MSQLYTSEEVDEIVKQAVLEALADKNPEQVDPAVAVLAQTIREGGWDESELDLLVDSLKGNEAATINNDGLTCQLQYINKCLGLEGLKQELNERGLI